MPTIITAPPGAFWQAYKPDEDGDPVRVPIFALSVPSVDDTREWAADGSLYALSGTGQWLPVLAPSPGAAEGPGGLLGYWQSR